ncbi:sigma-54-dependent transcriptional regulator [Azospirillum sp. sgz302134]
MLKKVEHDDTSAKPASGDRMPLVASSESMHRVLHDARVVATRPGSVLITGESGTGKTRLCEEIHAASPRRAGPFRRRGCGEFDLGTLEATLFGHSRDAYTSSQTDQPGVLLEVNGGTLVLDDVDCLPLRAQAGLLRFLDDGGFYRLGEPGKLCVSDVRIIVTTNVDLEALVNAGKFRRDLWFRLRRWRLHVPPLRARREDIRELANLFLWEFHASAGGSPSIAPRFDDEVLEFFQLLSWPGNIRELRDAVENIALFGEARQSVYGLSTVARVLFNSDHGPTPGQFDCSTGTVDDAHVLRILQMTQWNISMASRILGRSRTTLYKIIKTHGWKEV